MKKKLLYTILVVIVITSCKKYPDGPLLSIFTKEHRIVNGDWIVDYFSINGNDSSAYFKDPYYGKYRFHQAHGDNDPTYEFRCNNLIVNPNEGFSGHWAFTNNKKDIEISTSTPFPPNNSLMPPNNITLHQPCIWAIQRLTMKDFWLKSNYNGKEYYLKLKR
ncbi:MAG: hypothetical protein A3F72_12150 [Bacteroidetes bacterium RIFCSPLOWO2_12_FULL_35_15]|nr:MAG: hypothetical protein A3F72_12150 [Bacteroidetes bacterium RIFCSPLOWO2_12_FULL_35_15]